MPHNTATSRGNLSRADEVELSESDFRDILKLIRDVTGITMGEQKRQLVYRRIRTRLQETGIPTFRDYVDYIRSGDSPEVEKFCNAVTTNLTSFFRENHHFEYLAKTILPELTAKKRKSKRIRIWSAGCSTGEEPYSIAMTVLETFSQYKNWDLKVLCTDLDSDVVGKARAGVYPDGRIDGVSVARRKRWFENIGTANDPEYSATAELRDPLTFNQLNLMHDWPMRGKFDVIFCRNVVIYFDKDTQRKLVARYEKVLEDGGYLILGHSESLFKVSENFELLGNTIYRKLG